MRRKRIASVSSCLPDWWELFLGIAEWTSPRSLQQPQSFTTPQQGRYIALFQTEKLIRASIYTANSPLRSPKPSSPHRGTLPTSLTLRSPATHDAHHHPARLPGIKNGSPHPHTPPKRSSCRPQNHHFLSSASSAPTCSRPQRPR